MTRNTRSAVIVVEVEADTGTRLPTSRRKLLELAADTRTGLPVDLVQDVADEQAAKTVFTIVM